MPTTNQLINNPRIPKKHKKSHWSFPQKSGICKKVGKMKPKKPNSALRSYARVITYLKKKRKEVTVYIPGEGHNLQEYSRVLFCGGGPKDLVGVKYHVIRGYSDCEGVKNRKQGRSLYGTKKS
ncbi:5335_t:CDS:1 [Racocetra fulgida]|uniref:5335_t:CDS:1 n=1 Tax=Racocetra fulgida TaxID=60492 RepID=A0A9N9EM54_9GLOM|nr:5335_t:CDS:1 [Racocetra fulgida]